jgi:hypothetical protein
LKALSDRARSAPVRAKDNNQLIIFIFHSFLYSEELISFISEEQLKLT